MRKLTPRQMTEARRLARLVIEDSLRARIPASQMNKAVNDLIAKNPMFIRMAVKRWRMK